MEPREEVVIAMYDFTGTENHDLPLTRGEEYTILEKCDVNWYRARNQYGYVYVCVCIHVCSQIIFNDNYYYIV